MSVPAATALPRRAPLAVEAAAHLRARLQAGAWKTQLPGEQTLARQLQVGRNTVRAALAILEAEGLLVNRTGCRRQLVAPAAPAPVRVRSALLLQGLPQASLPASTLLWMDALRCRLEARGWKLEVRVEPAVYRRAPNRPLEALAAEHPQAVWILHRSTAAMQAWFERRGLQAVLAGSRHAGISLPLVDTDYRAASRHAAGRFLALGHRRLAVLQSRERLAGDAESLAGFREGAGTASLDLITHGDAPDEVVAALQRRLTQPQPPTALFVLRAEHAATALTWLLRQGIAVPRQLSLLVRDDEPFLGHLHPEPARYRRSPEAYAHKLARLVTALGTGGGIRQREQRLIPAFLPGQTLGPAPRG